MSEKFRYLVEEEIAIEGRIDQSQLEETKSRFKSCVYLAADSDSDCAVVGGIATYAPEVAVTHLPVRPSDPTFEGGLTVVLAERIATAVEQAEKPVLVQCTGAVRAGAGAALYLALKNGWSADECLEYAQSEGLGFVNVPKLATWVKQSVPYLGKPHSTKLRFLEEGLAIEGTITPEMVEAHKAAGFASLVYLCTDIDADRGLAAGYEEGLAPAFEESRHYPVAMSEELTTDLAVSIVTEIEQLPRPLLVQCRGSNRASAPVAMYLAKKNQWSVADVEDFSETHELPCATIPKLKEWVNNYVSTLEESEGQC